MVDPRKGPRKGVGGRERVKIGRGMFLKLWGPYVDPQSEKFSVGLAGHDSGESRKTEAHGLAVGLCDGPSGSPGGLDGLVVCPTGKVVSTSLSAGLSRSSGPRVTGRIGDVAGASGVADVASPDLATSSCLWQDAPDAAVRCDWWALPSDAGRPSMSSAHGRGSPGVRGPASWHAG